MSDKATTIPPRYISVTAAPDYPELRVDVQVNLCRNEQRVLWGGPSYSAELDALIEELTAGSALLQADDTSAEQREQLQARAVTIEAEVDAARARARLAYGAMLAQVYHGRRYSAYGLDFDFSTAEAAAATMEREDLPEDAKEWLRGLPDLALDAYREHIRKNCRASLLEQLSTGG